MYNAVAGFSNRRAKETRWLEFRKVRPAARLRLFCFPPAGGGAVLFRSWAESVHPYVDVCPVELPGRGRRFLEPSFLSVQPLIDQLHIALNPYLDLPFALFGHSMGALIAFEFARRCQIEKTPVTHIFASARKAPQLPCHLCTTYDLPRMDFITQLRSSRFVPDEILDNDHVLDLHLPKLRADMQLCQTYSYVQGAVLSCSLKAYGGLQDAHVSREELLAWREQISGAFSISMVPGDHFFLSHTAFHHLVAKDLTCLPELSLAPK